MPKSTKRGLTSRLIRRSLSIVFGLIGAGFRLLYERLIIPLKWWILRIVALALTLFLLVLSLTPLFLDGYERRVLAEMLYHEARSETSWGRWAIVAVTENRMRDTQHFPYVDSLKEVITDKKHGCQYSYYCDGRSDKIPEGETGEWIWIEAWFFQSWVHLGMLPDITFGALFYKNTQTATSKWFKDQVASGQFQEVPLIPYGNHAFYWVVD